MGKDVIVALDFDGRDKTLAFLDLFTEEKPFVKIGMELFYAEGPSIVREVRARGHKIFLDLKLHDIPMEDVVLHYAENVARAGLDGVVCSPLEAERIHKHCGAGFLTVTPGVRFAGGDAGDQKRVATPALAKAIGSDYIVVGRPITQAENPVAAYRRCAAEFIG